MSRALTSLIVPASLALAFAACSPFASGGDSGFLVLEDEAATPGSTCVFTATGTEPHISSGLITADAEIGYLIHPLLQSRITPVGLGSNGLSTIGTNDQRIIFTEGAHIDISFNGSSLFTNQELDDMASAGLTHNDTLFSTSLPPGGFAATEFEGVSVPLLQSIGNALRGGTSTSVQVEVSAVIYGYMGNDQNDEVDASAFKFPVTVCTNCVAQDLGACPQTPMTLPDTDPCNPYQDGEVQCCHDANQNLICPSVAATTTP